MITMFWIAAVFFVAGIFAELHDRKEFNRR